MLTYKKINIEAASNPIMIINTLQHDNIIMVIIFSVQNPLKIHKLYQVFLTKSNTITQHKYAMISFQ